MKKIVKELKERKNYHCNKDKLFVSCFRTKMKGIIGDVFEVAINVTRKGGFEL